MPAFLRPGDDAPTVGLSDSSGQGRLFEHCLLALGRLAEATPLVLILEDVHWADRSTLELVGFLVRNLRLAPVALLVSYRSDELHGRHPLLPFLAEQERAGRAERIELARFDRRELAEQLAAILDAEPDRELVERIAARSQGNAFYAEELLATPSSRGRLPNTLREVLLARFATLSESTQEVVRVAAAGGARLAPALVARVAGIEQGRLDAALAEAVERQVLVPLEGQTAARCNVVRWRLLRLIEAPASGAI